MQLMEIGLMIATNILYNGFNAIYTKGKHGMILEIEEVVQPPIHNTFIPKKRFEEGKCEALYQYGRCTMIFKSLYLLALVLGFSILCFVRNVIQVNAKYIFFFIRQCCRLEISQKNYFKNQSLVDTICIILFYLYKY